MPDFQTNTLTSFRKQLLAMTLAAVALPSVASAQNADTVTLTFANGQDDVSGSLISFNDNKFLIETSIGRIAIPANAAFCQGSACPASTLAPVAENEAEDTEIVLRSKDGSMEIAGEFIAVEGAQYVIETAIGSQRIDVQLVNCEGAGCVDDAGASEIDRVVQLVGGNVTMIGELIGYEDDVYLINEETMGKIRVSGSQFECRGAVCP